MDRGWMGFIDFQDGVLVFGFSFGIWDFSFWDLGFLFLGFAFLSLIF